MIVFTSLTILIISLQLSGDVFCETETVLMTEVFAFPIDPPMFNWTYEGIDDQYIYRPSLVNKPDLPPWIHYKYSKRHHCGFLYGVPQKHNSGTQLEIIGLNQLTYETRRHALNIHVTEKLNPARNEVQFKVDNLNVEDMFDVHRMERLKNVFKRKLWRESEDDLYVTFLESAIHLGGRLPLRPNEGEGVVLRLGSRSEFSPELLELQEEVKPLWKLQSCPRDFKRTTVERIFREVGFILDWCSFRLLETDGSAMHHLSNENNEIDHQRLENGGERWISIPKHDIPFRNYANEFVYTMIGPIIIMIILLWMLSFILCYHYEGILKRNPLSTPEQTMLNTAQYPSTARDVQYNPTTEAIIRSRTNSPNSSLARSTYCQPSPPPYPAGSKQEF